LSRFKISFQPYGKTFQVKEGKDILSVAIENKIDIPSICNGDKLCGKCVIKITEGKDEPSPVEKKYFSDIQIDEGFRLACRTKVKDNISVWVLNENEMETTQVLTAGLETEFKIEPDYSEIVISNYQKPSLENFKSYINTFYDALPAEFRKFNLSFELLKRVYTILQSNGQLVIKFKNKEIIDIYSGDRNSSDRNKSYGIAFDIGTTTVVGLLVELDSGKTVKIASRTNPQVSVGADVITRVNYTINEKDGLNRLQDLIIACLNEIINELCSETNIQTQSIFSVSIASNTVMNHILLGVDPKSMAFAPYVSVFNTPISIKSSDVGLVTSTNRDIYVLPNISGFVGGDIVALILAHKLIDTDKITVAIDIGTNGEIVIGSSKKLLSCSTAAGPAFEGGHISIGMRASNGAIDTVSIENEKFIYHVIGNVAPKGICGTGLIDLVATLLNVGIIDESGRILSKDELEGEARNFKYRVVETNTSNGFIVTFKSDGIPNDLVLKQKDIRELQLAKAAMAAGYSVLLSDLGLSEEDIEQVLIAGAFGSYIKKESALRIGLLPKVDITKIKSIGNSSSIGAKQYLLSESCRNECNRIINHTGFVELALRPDFQEKFMDSMFF
jgi:uncharacterized 2Fe-2S/4Fe-4S cluster protein (DUF4445 family)